MKCIKDNDSSEKQLNDEKINDEINQIEKYPLKIWRFMYLLFNCMYFHYKEILKNFYTAKCPERKKIPVEKGMWLILLVARIHGIHILKNENGENKICKWALLSSSFNIAVFTITSSFITYFSLTYENVPFLVYVSLMPVAISVNYGLYTCIMIMKNKNLTMKFMNEISKIEIYFPKLGYYYFVLVFLGVGSLLSAYFYTFIIQSYFRLYLGPIVLSIYIPMVSDAYLVVFIYVFKGAYDNMTEMVCDINNWTEKEVNNISLGWVKLKQLICFHNKVSFFLFL